MKEKLYQLIHLQNCDSRIQQILEKKNRCPSKIEQQEKDIEARQQAFDEDRNQLEMLRKERKAQEEEVQDIDIRIKKSRSKLSNIKNNKEYQAALKEIDGLTKQQSKIEDEILIIMENIEEVETKVTHNELALKDLQAEFEQTKQEILKELDLLEKEYDEINREKSGFCHLIERDLLKRYSFLRDRRGGRAVGAVKNGICQACNMGIPPQRFNELRKGSALIFCPNCQRIIYWAEDEYYQQMGLS